MPNIATLSPLRRRLCSYDHAARVAGAMADAGANVTIISTVDPLQPWRVLEAERQDDERILACA